jgi:hypothetical protein
VAGPPQPGYAAQIFLLLAATKKKWAYAKIADMIPRTASVTW